jgi:phytoene synthase
LHLARELRRLDADRCLAVLAAPPPDPAPLLALFLLNAELARSGEVSQGPLLAELRLKWWHDALAEAAAGQPKEQPVLQALAAPLSAGRLPLAEVQGLVAVRQDELAEAPFADLAALAAHAAAGGGRLTALAARLLGAQGNEAEAAAKIGTAFALLGLLRAAGHHAALGRLLLPMEETAHAGATLQSLREGKRGTDLAPLAQAVASRAATLLGEARRLQPRLPRGRAAPFVVAALADLYLRRLQQARWNPLAAAFVRPPPGRAWRLLLHRLRGRT